MVTPYEERRPNQLMMLYHNAEWKGCEEGLQALSLARERDPELRATLFGVPARPASLPDWIDYYQSPSREIIARVVQPGGHLRRSQQDRGMGSYWL